MAKPIPVFVFALAAFAETSERSPSEFGPGAAEHQAMDELFVSLCRSPARDSANFMVKLGLAIDENGGAAGLCDRACASSADVEELWLSQIAEGRGGFSGVARATSERRIGAGQRISFELRHVLGWRIEAHAADATSTARVKLLRAERDGPSAS